VSKLCFSYPPDGPVSGSGAASLPEREAASAARRDLYRMPFPCYSYPSMCYSYPGDGPRGGGDSGGPQPSLPSLRRMPYPCFRY
jgi:hypothetical protein